PVGGQARGCARARWRRSAARTHPAPAQAVLARAHPPERGTWRPRGRAAAGPGRAGPGRAVDSRQRTPPPGHPGPAAAPSRNAARGLHRAALTPHARVRGFRPPSARLSVSRQSSPPMNPNYLDFEQPIADLEAKIHELRQASNGPAVNIDAEINALQDKLRKRTAHIFRDLSP